MEQLVAYVRHLFQRVTLLTLIQKPNERNGHCGVGRFVTAMAFGGDASSPPLILCTGEGVATEGTGE